MNVRDVILFKKYMAGSVGDNETVFVNCDFNGDGVINVNDLILLKKMFA